MNKTKLYLYLICSIFILNVNGIFADEKEILKWAADTESGVPYVYHDQEDLSRLVGFETEIIEAIAEKLNMKPVHFQNQWDNLLVGLKNRQDYDVVINGYEITEPNMKLVNFSKPYYITYEQIIVKKGREGIETLSDLIGKKVGTLIGSYAEDLLNAQEGIDVKSTESESNSFKDLKYGRIDAVLIDFPVALYYAKDDPELELVGTPIGQVSYGIAVRKEKPELLAKINKALKELKDSGKLKSILEKYELWDDFMETNYPHADTISPLKVDSAAAKSAEMSKLDERRKQMAEGMNLEKYWDATQEFIKAAGWTILLSITSMLLAITVGLFVSLTRTYAPPPFSQLARVYIELIRGTPLLIQLFFIHYGIPEISKHIFTDPIALHPFVSAVIGLGLNYGAYEAENYRAGLFSVPRGQMEAAIALGMTRKQALRHVIVPQAIRLVIPPMTNDFISLLKDSSLVSVIAMVELTKKYGELASSYNDHFGLGLLVAAIYLIIGLPFVRLSRWAEDKFSVDKRKKVNM